MSGYFGSGSARALVLTAGILQLGVGLTSLLAPAPAATYISLATAGAASLAGLVSVGLAIERYPIQALVVNILGPVFVWPGFMMAVLRRLVHPAAGHALVATGVVTLAVFVILSLKALAPRRTGESGAAGASSA